MIHIEFDNESNIPEESVQLAARRAEQYDARLGSIRGIPSPRVAAHASSAAGMIASVAKSFHRITGRFASTSIEATPMRSDYKAAMSASGGIQPRHLPWLACERVITGTYHVVQKRVGFQLAFTMKVPPTTVTLNLHENEDESINPDEHDATLACGIAQVPFPLHLPSGMRTEDLAAALKLIMPAIRKSAVTLWLQSEGGTKEVF